MLLDQVNQTVCLQDVDVWETVHIADSMHTWGQHVQLRQDCCTSGASRNSADTDLPRLMCMQHQPCGASEFHISGELSCD